MPRSEKGADAIDFYLDDLSRVPALAREEELALALVVEDAHEKLRRAVLSHPPSLRRLAARLAATDGSALQVAAVLTDPLSQGLETEQLVGLLQRAGQQLASLLSGDPNRECPAATEAATALPLGRELLFELFSLGEEEALAESGPRASEWQQVASALRSADHAKAKLVERNLRLVVVLARRYIGRGLPLSDLIQEGNLGLLRAIDGFDPHRGFRLATYASWWIRQAMQHALAEQTRTIRVPRHLTEAAAAVNRFSRGFHANAGRAPTTEEIASGLGVPLARVAAAIELGPDTVSLETPLGSDDSLELGDVIADGEGPNPADALLVKDFANQTRGALDALSPEERAVIALRFGLDAAGPHSVEEVASLRRIGADRVRQIESRALRKLRHAKRTRQLRAYSRE